MLAEVGMQQRARDGDGGKLKRERRYHSMCEKASVREQANERKITSCEGRGGEGEGDPGRREEGKKRSSEIGKVALQEVVRGCQTVGSVKQIHTRILYVMQLNKRGQAPILSQKVF